MRSKNNWSARTNTTVLWSLRFWRNTYFANLRNNMFRPQQIVFSFLLKLVWNLILQPQNFLYASNIYCFCAVQICLYSIIFRSTHLVSAYPLSFFERSYAHAEANKTLIFIFLRLRNASFPGAFPDAIFLSSPRSWFLQIYPTLLQSLILYFFVRILACLAFFVCSISHVFVCENFCEKKRFKATYR